MNAGTGGLPPGFADEGTLVIRGGGGPFDRDERFRVERLADGGLAISSEIRAADGSFAFDCRWEYDPALDARRASGAGRRGDLRLAVEIERLDGRRGIVHERIGQATTERLIELPPGALLDLEPSALPMWIMTGRYDRTRGGPQRFIWAGRSLQRELVLEGGEVTATLAGRTGQDPEALDHFHLLERLPNPAGGHFEIEFDLYTDGGGRFMAFRVHGQHFQVLGLRAGAAGLREQVGDGRR